jgi:hypothetical protein
MSWAKACAASLAWSVAMLADELVETRTRYQKAGGKKGRILGRGRKPKRRRKMRETEGAKR